MARPKKQQGDKRSEQVRVRYSPAERLQAQEAAQKAGLSLSEYIREQSLNGRVVVKQSRTLDHAAFDQLRRIGVNLNQLARRANQSGEIPPGLDTALSALQTIIERELSGAPQPEQTATPQPAALTNQWFFAVDPNASFEELDDAKTFEVYQPPSKPDLDDGP